MHIILAVLIAALVLRMVYRFLIDFPPYPGKSPLQGTNVDGLMEESEFWNLIMESRRTSNGRYDDQILALTDLLERKSLNDIIAFERAFTALMNQANDFRFWEAAYALNWGCSDDCFIDFCAWWIGQGKNKFYWSLRLPRSLFLFVVKEQFQQYEGLQYCASDAYKNLNGRDMPVSDIELAATQGKLFNEGLAFLKHPELALLAW